MFCKVCRQFPELCDNDSSLVKGVTRNFKKETLRFHDKSVKHQLCVSKQNAKNNPSETALAKSFQKAERLNVPLYAALFNTAYYVATENESFLKYPELRNLLEKSDVKVSENYRNDKACKEFCIYSAEVVKDEVADDIKSARYISVLSDGSTDKGIREQELVYVRYVDSTGNLKTKLADIVQLQHQHAHGVKDGILQGLETVGVDADVLAKKLVGINTDGAAVNLGQKGGAVKLLIDTLNERVNEEDCSRYMVVVHCVAHTLELAVCDAKKGCPYLEEFEKVLKGIFKLYYKSPKRRRELYEIATNLDKELKHYGGVQQVRWVASQNRALKALLDNYEVTVIHLEEIASGKDETADKAKNYLNNLTTERFLTFLHFMLDWTQVLSEISKVFQEKHCLISQIASRVTELKQKLNKMKTKRGKMLRQFLTEKESGVFKGSEVTRPQKRGRQAQETPEAISKDLNTLLTSSENFLEERFIQHTTGEPHSLFSVFNFQNWPENDVKHREEFQNYGDEEIDKLLSMYPPRLISDEEKEKASDEWLDLKLYMKRKSFKSVQDGYENMLKSSDTAHIKNISTLVKIMLTISPSTAECERGFSKMNMIKTDKRTRLQYDSLAPLVRINCDGPPLKDFKPEPAIQKWLDAAKGTRHTSGHKLPGPRPKKAAVMEEKSSDSD